MSSPHRETVEMLHFQRSLLNLAGTVDAHEAGDSSSRTDAKPPASEHATERAAERATEPSIEHCLILEAWARRIEQPRRLAS